MLLGSSRDLAVLARRTYLESLRHGVGDLVAACDEAARHLAGQISHDPALYQRRRDLVLDLPRGVAPWQRGLQEHLGEALEALTTGAQPRTRPVSLDLPVGQLQLVDDAAIELDLMASRLAETVADRAGWEYTDLCSRLSLLEQGQAQPGERPGEVLKPAVVARWVLDAWMAAGLGKEHWKTLQPQLHDEVALLAEAAYHEANRVLLDHGVRPEIDLRPFIRRAKDAGVVHRLRPTTPDPVPASVGGVSATGAAAPAGGSGSGGGGFAGGPAGAGWGGGAGGASSGAGAGTTRGPGPGAAGQAAGFHPGGHGAPAGSGDPAGPASWHGTVPGGAVGGVDRAAGAASSAVPAGPNAPQGAGEGAQARAGGWSGASGGLPGAMAAGQATGQDGTAPSGPGQLTGRTNRVTTSGGQLSGGSYDETRLLTQSHGLRGRAGQGQAVLGRLNQLVSQQVPGFDPTSPMPESQRPGLAPALDAALQQAQSDVRQHAAEGGEAAPAAVLRDLQQHKQALKQAAATPAERATIEIVALLFQAILMEERLPASVRVWFARLQMPVLRVAVGEPDFFATLNHPARLLIDRMGSCVMGLAGTADAADDDELHQEIKRIVQTVEAYPDTGRRVFQTVLIEFERFLVRYFREGNEASRKGVSLAQQLEQREALAIQYTIELRKMLETVPVHRSVRDFLFKVWADVMAHSATIGSPGDEDTRGLRRLAGELIWSASAKTTREERNEVLQRLPPLLKALRAGMRRAGVSGDRQDRHIKELNDALAAAFSAKAAQISAERLREVTHRLEALDELLPEMGDVEIDADMVRDLSGYENVDLEVVAGGGTMPTPAMLGWAGELQLGAWFQLDYRGRQEAVQLAWRGLQKQLALFVTPQGRCVLFQVHRLGAFLQAGLLVPVEEESLTVRATRDALAKLDADPDRLLR